MRSAPIRPTVGREAAGQENGLFLVQFNAEELGRDVGLFLGGWSMGGKVRHHRIQRQGIGLAWSSVKHAAPRLLSRGRTADVVAFFLRDGNDRPMPYCTVCVSIASHT